MLHEQVQSKVRTISSISERSLEAGGKRFRPALVILGALAADPEGEITRATHLAAGVELLHLATLIHDDVVDGSACRRGSASTNALFGNKLSVLIGDYLVSRSFGILAADGDGRIIDRMAAVSVALSEGEVLELVMRGTLGELESLYWKMIDRKTARLISACLEIGGISVNGSEDAIEALASFGERIGLVFQLTDDILDVAGVSEVLGKPVGADLLDGKVTLPYILALRELPPEVQEDYLSRIFDGCASQEDASFLIKIACDAGVPASCRALAREQVDIALKQLMRLPSTPARGILEDVGSYLLARSS